jgi:hypothetical protein
VLSPQIASIIGSTLAKFAERISGGESPDGREGREAPLNTRLGSALRSSAGAKRHLQFNELQRQDTRRTRRGRGGGSAKPRVRSTQRFDGIAALEAVEFSQDLGACLPVVDQHGLVNHELVFDQHSETPDA